MYSRGDDVKNLEKAKIILEELDEVIQINWNFEETYLKAILKALKKIEEEENND